MTFAGGIVVQVERVLTGDICGIGRGDWEIRSGVWRLFGARGEDSGGYLRREALRGGVAWRGRQV